MNSMSRAYEWWWILAIAGIVDVLFGIAALLWPGLTLNDFIYLFGFYAIILGIVQWFFTYRASGLPTLWWTHLIVGAACVLAGIAALFWPGETAVTLLYVIAIWAVVVGVVEIASAFILNRLYPGIAGIISVMFAMMLFANPTGGALALITVIGVFALVRGVIVMIESVRAMATPAA